MFLAMDKCGSKIPRNNVIDCHLLPAGRQMAIKNSVSNFFDLHSSIVLMLLIYAYLVCSSYLR